MSERGPTVHPIPYESTLKHCRQGRHDDCPGFFERNDEHLVIEVNCLCCAEGHGETKRAIVHEEAN